MERSRWLGWLGDALWLLAWGLASSLGCVLAAGQLSATFDEPIYLVRGLEHWRTGSHAGLMQLGTMPLPVDVQTLPLYLWERWHGVRFDAAADFARLLPWARAGTLVFWWLLLIHGWLAARQLAGPWGGRLAVALLACEPSFLAHAGLATTDIAITACLLALVYHFQRGREAGWLRRVAWPGLWFAAALLAKASGMVFGPLCLLVIEADRLRRTPAGLRWAQLRASAGDLAQVFALGMVLTFVYCGSDWQPQPSFVAWAHHLPADRFGRTMVWLSENLCIFSNAGEGLVRQVKHNIHGHGVYLLGQMNDRSLWYYFPVLLTIKLSLPLLLLPPVLLVVRPRALVNWACLAALALLLFSVNCRVQIGVRLVLPLVALAVTGLAAALTHAVQQSGPGWRKRLLVGGIVLGLAWTATAAVLVWPEENCYVNELWGGSWDGYRRVSDANYDWGQGLNELAGWYQGHAGAPLDVWYVGSDPAIFHAPYHHLPLHALPIRQPADVLPRVRGHYLAVSTTFLYGIMCPTAEHWRANAFLQAHRPVARTTTFFIYDFTQEGDQPPPSRGAPPGPSPETPPPLANR